MEVITWIPVYVMSWCSIYDIKLPKQYKSFILRRFNQEMYFLLDELVYWSKLEPVFYWLSEWLVNCSWFILKPMDWIFYFYFLGDKFWVIGWFWGGSELITATLAHFTQRPEDLWCPGRAGRTPGGERKRTLRTQKGWKALWLWTRPLVWFVISGFSFSPTRSDIYPHSGNKQKT